MAEHSHPPPGHFNISGGQVNIGGSNASFTQYNYYTPEAALTEFRNILDAIEQHVSDFRDSAAARGQIQVIELALADRDAAAGPAVRGALGQLADQVATGATLADAIAKAVDLVIRYWPF